LLLGGDLMMMLIKNFEEWMEVMEMYQIMLLMNFDLLNYERLYHLDDYH
jgi:hypothetical protein